MTPEPIRALPRGSQTVLEYRDHLLFELEYGYYKKAGRFHWKDVLDEEPCPGIGLNTRVLQTALTSGKHFIIHNQKTGEHLVLKEYTARTKIQEGRYGEEDNPIILPLSCFTTQVERLGLDIKDGDTKVKS